MKQSFHLHFDRDLSKAGSATLREAVRRGLLSQHEAMIHDQQWAQFSICLLYTSPSPRDS